MECQSLIFQYHNGDGLVWGDPLAIHRELLYGCQGQVDRILSLAEAESTPENYAEVMQAQETLFRAIRQAFRMAPFDPVTGNGATEERCDEALRALVEFMRKKKEKPENSPTSSTPTDAPTV